MLLLLLHIFVIYLHQCMGAFDSLNLQAPDVLARKFPSRCYGILNYPIKVNTNWATPPGTETPSLTPNYAVPPFFSCRKDFENALEPLDAIKTIVNKTCYEAITRYMCRATFPPSDIQDGHIPNTNAFIKALYGMVPEPPLCDAINAQCSEYELAMIDFGLKGLEVFVPFWFNYTYQYHTPTFQATYMSHGTKGGAFFYCNDETWVSPTSTIRTSIIPDLPQFNSTLGLTGVVTAAPIRGALCEPYQGEVCANMFDGSNIIVSHQYTGLAGTTEQSTVEAGLQSTRFIVNLLPLLNGCRTAFYKLMCARAFQKCELRHILLTNPSIATKNFQVGWQFQYLPTVAASKGKTVPQLQAENPGHWLTQLPTLLHYYKPKRSLCDDVHAKCPSSIWNNSLAIGLGMDDCANEFSSLVGDYLDEDEDKEYCLSDNERLAIYGNTLEPTFPISNYNNTFNVAVEPNDMADITDEIVNTLSSKAPDCPLPFQPSNDPSVTVNTGRCASPCPTLLWRESEYESVDTLFTVLLVFSVILSFSLLATYAAFKKARRNMYHIYFTVNVFMIQLMLLTSVGAPGGDVDRSIGQTDFPGMYSHVRCEDRAHGTKRGYCLWQSMFMLFGGGSCVSWWFIQTVELYLQIAWGARKWSKAKKRNKDIIYYFWGYGFPLITVIVGASLDALGNIEDGGAAWCLFIGDALGWGIFYGPIMAQSCIGTCFMVFIIRQLWISSVAMKSHKKRGWWKLYIRPLIFVGAMLFVWAFIFIFRFKVQFGSDDWKEQSAKYGLCLLQEKPAELASTGTVIDCEPLRQQGPIVWLVFLHIVIGSLGILTFILYYSYENFIMWYHLCAGKAYNFSQTSGESQSQSHSKSGSKRVLRTGASSGGGSRKNLHATGSSDRQLKYVGAAPTSSATTSTEMVQIDESNVSTSSKSQQPPPSTTITRQQQTKPVHTRTPSGLALNSDLPTNVVISYDDNADNRKPVLDPQQSLVSLQEADETISED